MVFEKSLVHVFSKLHSTNMMVYIKISVCQYKLSYVVVVKYLTKQCMYFCFSESRKPVIHIEEEILIKSE